MIRYYLKTIENFIDKLEVQSFDGWTEGEINGYLTACKSIKEEVNRVQNSEISDSMEDR
jgi:hypothetical protein